MEFDTVILSGLQNICGKKSWLNVVLLSVKSCPFGRKKILDILKTRHRELQLQSNYQFYQSFLNGKQHYRINSANYPWSTQSSIFHQCYNSLLSNSNQNMTPEVALHMIGQDCCMNEVFVKFNIPSSSANDAFVERNYLTIHALKPLPIAGSVQDKYVQIPLLASETPLNVELLPEYYQTSITDAVQDLLSHHGVTVNFNHSEILFINVQNAVETSMIEFTSVQQQMTSQHAQYSRYHYVCNQYNPEAFLRLENQYFLLTAMIEKNESPDGSLNYSILSNPNITQKWTRIVNDECKNVIQRKDFLPARSFARNVVVFVYQKLPFPSPTNLNIPLFIPNDESLRVSARKNQPSDFISTITIDSEYWNQFSAAGDSTTGNNALSSLMFFIMNCIFFFANLKRIICC
jgi:hypothetical protein